MLLLNWRENYLKYGPHASTHDVIKALAITIMIVDHVGTFFFPEDLWWRAVGRTGFPIWFFLAGYARPGKGLGYEIIILAFLMLLADFYASEPLTPVNALFSIIICRLFIASYYQKSRDWGDYVIFLSLGAVFLFPSLFLFEYGLQAILFAMSGYLVRHEKKEAVPFIWISFLIFIAVQVFSFDFKFTPAQFVFMTLVTALVVHRLSRFRLVFLDNIPKALAVPVNAMGRNSLYIYFVHFVLFVLVSRLLLEGQEPFQIHLLNPDR